MALTAGTALGPYEIVGALGAGGMGEVYRARDSRLHREVAIKVLPESVTDGDAWGRFQREARAASALNHPHICAVYDIGEANGRPFLVMELLEGQTLYDVLRTGPLDPSTAVQFAVEIADALDAAHAKGVVHRDVKPGNIMITGRRHVKVLDFGLAKTVSESDPTLLETLAKTGFIVGTPQYMAPEVLQGQAGDARSDLWSFGVVFYQMLSGRLPFGAPTPIGAAAAILHETAAPLSVTIPAELHIIVSRCLAKRRDDRFASAAELREALETFQRAVGGPGTDDVPRTVTGAPASSNAEANDALALAMQFMRVQNDILRGQKMLERALELDPHFAEARRFHAFNYVIQILNGYSNDASLLYTAEDELRQAEADDPSLASLASAFAAVYLSQGRKEMIPIDALERACSQGPVARDAMLWRAILWWLGGDAEAAKSLVRQSVEREPLFGAPRMILGEILRVEGNPLGAIREQLRVLDQAPINVAAIHYLAIAYLDAGEIAKARTLLESRRDEFRNNFLWRSAWALLLACEGKRSEALEAMDDEIHKFARIAFGETLQIAEFYAVIGDVSKAVDWVETAVRSGDERAHWFRRSPRLTAIQTDPRFLRILQSVEARRKPGSRRDPSQG